MREGPHPVGWAVGVAASTVHAVLARHGRSRLVSRPRPEEAIRYEYARPGGLIHVDIKKLGRILKPGHRVTGDRRGQAKGKAGWQYLFVAIDDHSRLGFASVYRDETSDSAIAFLTELVRFYTTRDQRRAGPDRQRQLLQTPLERRLRRPRHQSEADTPLPAANQRQGRTVHPHDARALAYAYAYTNESDRLAALAPALDFYNRFRPHRALSGLTPLQRVNNLPGTNT